MQLVFVSVKKRFGLASDRAFNWPWVWTNSLVLVIFGSNIATIFDNVIKKSSMSFSSPWISLLYLLIRFLMSVVVNIWPEDLETWSAISLVGAFDKSKLLLNFCRSPEKHEGIRTRKFWRSFRHHWRCGRDFCWELCGSKFTSGKQQQRGITGVIDLWQQTSWSFDCGAQEKAAGQNKICWSWCHSYDRHIFWYKKKGNIRKKNLLSAIIES